MGGLAGSLVSIGAIFAGFFAQKMLLSGIIKKVYQIRKYNDIQENDKAVGSGKDNESKKKKNNNNKNKVVDEKTMLRPG